MLFDRQARDSVEAELGSDESLLWFSRPNPLRVALKAYPFLLFGISGVAISAPLTAQWIVGPMSHLLTATPPETVGMGLTLLVFWILAIAALSVPLAMYLSARATIYALTSGRIVVVREGRPVQSFERADVDQSTCKEFKDATGDLIITFKQSRDNSETQDAIQMLGIQRARTVERLLTSIASPLGSAPTQASSAVG